MKQLLKDELQGIEQDLWDICKQMYDHPELGDQEYESMKLLTSLLGKHGFSIETGIVGRPTLSRRNILVESLVRKFFILLNMMHSQGLVMAVGII